MREIAIFAPLVALTIAFGVYPKPIFDVTSVSVANLVEQHKLAMRYGAQERVARGGAEAAEKRRLRESAQKGPPRSPRLCVHPSSP